MDNKNFMENVFDNIGYIEEKQAEDVAIMHEAFVRYNERIDQLGKMVEKLSLITAAAENLYKAYDEERLEAIESGELVTLEDCIEELEEADEADEDEEEDDGDLDELDSIDDLEDEDSDKQ